MKKGIVILTLLLTAIPHLFGQCAMCRATLENNVSNGNIGLAASINIGILYLFFMPYLAAGVLAFFWYRTSKRSRMQSRMS